MVADLVLALRYRKKKFGHAGLIHKYRKYMRLSAAEKYEIIQKTSGVKGFGDFIFTTSDEYVTS